VTHALRILAVLCLVGLAGCSGLGGDPATETPAPDREFSLDVTSPGETTYAVDVRLLATPISTVELTDADGSTRTVTVPNETGNWVPAGDLPRSVAVDGDVERRVSFRGSGNFSVSASDLRPTPDAVYTVRVVTDDGERLVHWGVVRCGGHVTSLGLGLANASAPSLGVGCTD